MLRRILLALDLTPASLSAKRHALDLAVRHRAAVTGLVLIDPELVTPVEAIPMGAIAYKEHKDTVLLQKARADGEDLASQFADDCRIRGISAESQIVVDSALKALIGASDVCDLIAIGIDCAFDAATSEKLSSVLIGLLQGNSRPVLTAPAHEEMPSGLCTFVAYDGSVAAMRALQLFCCSRINVDREAIVSTVNGDAAIAEGISARAVRYMQEHGYKAKGHAIASSGDVTHSLLQSATDSDAGLIVAGAYGHQGWRQWLLGGTTKRLLETSRLPIFIHH